VRKALPLAPESAGKMSFDDYITKAKSLFNLRFKTEYQNRIEDAPRGKFRLKVQSQTPGFDENFLDPLWSARMLHKSKSIALCRQRSTLTLLLHQAINDGRCRRKHSSGLAWEPGSRANVYLLTIAATVIHLC
jgi:hypothetical protein